jgi:hypothetical protein
MAVSLLFATKRLNGGWGVQKSLLDDQHFLADLGEMLHQIFVWPRVGRVFIAAAMNVCLKARDSQANR